MRDRSCVERLVFILFALAILQPGYGMSDEARIALEKLKEKVATTGPVQPVQHTKAVAEQSAEDLLAEAPIFTKSESVEGRLKVGSTKESVIRILGLPKTISHHGNRTVFGYGDQTAFLENDKLFNWVGFEKDDSRFFKSTLEEGLNIGIDEEIVEVESTVLKSEAFVVKRSDFRSDADIKEYRYAMRWDQYDKAAKIAKKNSKANQKALQLLAEFKRCSPEQPVAQTYHYDSSGQKTYSSTSDKEQSLGREIQPRLSNGNYTIRTGPRGGKYHISASGKKVYHKKR